MGTRAGCIGVPTRVGEPPSSGTGCATGVGAGRELGLAASCSVGRCRIAVGSDGCGRRWGEGDWGLRAGKEEKEEMVVDGGVGQSQ